MIKNCYKNTMKYGIRLKAYPKENLIKNRCITINILVLKKIYNDTIHADFKYKKVLKDNKH